MKLGKQLVLTAAALSFSTSIFAQDTFILSSVQIETNYPRPGSQAAEALGVGGQAR